MSGQGESNPAPWWPTQTGKMELSCPLLTTRRVPQEKFPRKPYNKSFIDQACSVKVAGYWPRSFFYEFMDLDSVALHQLKNSSHVIIVLNAFVYFWISLHTLQHPYIPLEDLCTSLKTLPEFLYPWIPLSAPSALEYPCTPINTHISTFEYPCIPFYTHVNPWIPMYTPAYPCMPLHTPVNHCIPLYTHEKPFCNPWLYT